MPDFNVRSDAVNVEQIMEQIRARIREKRGVDYTEAQIKELASVKLEKFLDPRGVRSDLLEQFRRAQPPYAPPDLPNFAFEDQTLFESTRGPLRFIRRLLQPILKLFFNPNPLIQALNIQSKLNASAAEREAKRDAARYAFDQLHYEVMHNLVIETTRLGIEVKNLKMRLESLASRLEFNERRARALESAVVYKSGDEREGRREERRQESRRAEQSSRESREPREPREQREPREPREQPGRPQTVPVPPQPVQSTEPPAATAASTDDATAAGQAVTAEGPGQRSRRRRRRRGRRGGGSAAALMSGAPADAGSEQQIDADQGPEEGDFEESDASTGESESAAPAVVERREANPEPAPASAAQTPESPASASSEPQAEPAPQEPPADPSTAPEQ